MLGMIERQRSALFAELPVSAATRRDRLQRLLALIEQNGDTLIAALGRDHEHQSEASARATEIAPAIAAIRQALRGLPGQMRPIYEDGMIGRLLQGGDYIEFQPVGAIGIAAPAALAVHQTASLLASVLAAGNRAMLRFDVTTPHLAQCFAQLAPRYFDALELIVADMDAKAFAELPFDQFVTSEPADASRHEDAVPNAARGPVTIQRSGKSPVIIGRSADIAKAAEIIVAGKLEKSGHVPLTPDYLLIPAEQEEAIVAELWREAMHQRARMADKQADLPFSEVEYRRFTDLIENARARGAEILVADPSGGRPHQGVHYMPLHIVRHATDDMELMRSEICGPILPLRSYIEIDEAIGVIHRHKPPHAIYHFGHDAAERRQVLARTISSAIALDGRLLATSNPPRAGAAFALNNGLGDAGFRSFSLARRVYRHPVIDLSGLGGLTTKALPRTPIGSH